MLGAAVIVFREVLEAALVIAVLMGACRGVLGRVRWVSLGVGLGLLGACVVAALAGTLANAVDGRGQEIFNAVVLLLAVVMLGWHNVWMSSHGRQLAAELRKVGHAVGSGVKPLYVLLIVTALAVLREGSETVLFLYSMAVGDSWTNTLLGGLLGLAAGGALGWLLYRGLLRIPVRYFFVITGWLVLLLAAGLAANAASYLTQAGLLPTLGGVVWDSSGLLSQRSGLGMLLHVLIGYNDRPTGIQVVLYLTTLAVIFGLMRWQHRSQRVAYTERKYKAA